MIKYLAKQLKIDEGFRAFPYKCTAGFLTIGYGRNLDTNGLRRTEAQLLFDNDVSNGVCIGDDLPLMLYRVQLNSLKEREIGYGRNLDTQGITIEEAEVMLENDIQEVLTTLKTILPDIENFSGVRKYVLANMLFNLGAGRFKGFKMMLRALRVHDYATAAGEMKHSKWYGQVGKRAERLVAQMKTDKFELS